MNRLMSAEWYRVRHSNGLIKWMIFVCALFAFIGSSDGLVMKLQGNQAFVAYVENGMVMLMVYFPIFISALLVSSYSAKTFHYEVMAGNNTHHIILSKLLTTALVGCIIPIVCSAAVYVIYGALNGFGDTAYMAERMLIMVVIWIKISFVAVLITMIFKSVAGTALVFVRFAILEMVFELVLSAMNLTDAVADRVMLLSTMGQTFVLMKDKITSDDISTVVMVSVIEILILYVLSYKSYKKCWFN